MFSTNGTDPNREGVTPPPSTLGTASTGTASTHTASTGPAKGASERRLQVEGGTLAYDDEGTGPLVVLVPGLGDLRQEYRFLARELVAAGYRTVSLDLRGHGGSSVGWDDYGRKAAGGDLLALIEALDAGPATIVGNSFSAAPAVWAAAERPDAVDALVLIGPFVLPQPAKPLLQALTRVLFAGPWKVAAWSAYFGTLFPTRKPADFRAYRAALRANLAEPGRFEAVKAMMFSSEPDIAQRLAEVAAPTLVVMGSKDPDFTDPADEARRLADGLRGESLMIEGAGHYPHSEMPEAVATPVLAFLERTRRGA